MIPEDNIAYIDGQNLYKGTKSADVPWKVDLFRFRIYLKQKYNVKAAYYFLGYARHKYRDLYKEIQKAGFTLVFRMHSENMLGIKKGNVDTDIVFYAMEKMYRRKGFGKIVLVSGDGDYRLLVDFLIEEKRFRKILFPNKKRYSSLYKDLSRERFDYIENARDKIGEKKRGALGN